MCKLMMITMLQIISLSVSHATVQEKFDALRERHAGFVAAPFFKAMMDSESAAKLLKNKVDGVYTVEVVYHFDKGIDLFVRGVDSFYENVLSSYAMYINKMMLPLLSNRGYQSSYKKFIISEPKNSLYTIEYKQGDTMLKYSFKEGSIGLIEQIDYTEDNHKICVIFLSWKKILDHYVPVSIKSVSYDKIRSSSSFDLYDVETVER